MPVAIATAYNVLIVIVGLATIPLAILARHGARLWTALALLDALAFLGIYGLDLAHIFPGGPAMGPKVIVFESVGVMVAAALTVIAIRDLRSPLAISGQSDGRFTVSGIALLALLCLLIGAVAVYFGTIHALR